MREKGGGRRKKRKDKTEEDDLLQEGLGRSSNKEQESEDIKKV
jgi:hypothetical protein